MVLSPARSSVWRMSMAINSLSCYPCFAIGEACRMRASAVSSMTMMWLQGQFRSRLPHSQPIDARAEDGAHVLRLREETPAVSGNVVRRSSTSHRIVVGGKGAARPSRGCSMVIWQ